MAPPRIHDRIILDALEALDPEPFDGNVWRVTRTGREPLRGAAAHGRWSPSGEFEVLYTSLIREGALAEIGYRLSLQPVWPSRIEHEIHTITVQTERNLRFADVAGLAPFGVDATRYRSFDYSATQAIAAAANFLGFDGLIVPNARFACSNLVIFTERAPDLTLTETVSVDWDAWRRTAKPAK
jgi:RES domain-containing protein